MITRIWFPSGADMHIVNDFVDELSRDKNAILMENDTKEVRYTGCGYYILIQLPDGIIDLNLYVKILSEQKDIGFSFMECWDDHLLPMGLKYEMNLGNYLKLLQVS